MVNVKTSVSTLRTDRVDHDVFISYSRRDKDFVQALNEKLEKIDKDTWVDWSRIPATANWWEEIEYAIEATNTFVFVISPGSVCSEYCHKEIDHAAKYNKRLVPILRRELVDEKDAKALHPAMSAHQWIEFRESDDFDSALQTLIKAINTDLDYVRAHTRLLVRAIEWDKKERDDSFLLRGSDLEAAEQWITQGASKEPKSTDLQREYITTSRKAETARQRTEIRRQRILISVIAVFSILAGGTAVFALQQRHIAQKNAVTAQKNADRANAQATLAKKNADRANAQANRANAQTTLAKKNADRANTQATLAKKNAVTAQENEQEAKRQAGIAQENADRANAQTKLAKKNAVTAKRNEQRANQQTDLAKKNATTAQENEQEAKRQAGIAQENEKRAHSRELAANAILQLEIDPDQSVQLATKAMSEYQTTEAEDALRKSLFESRVRAKIQLPNHRHNKPIWTVAFSSDSKHVVATNTKEGTVKVLNIDTGKLENRISSVNGKAFTNGNFVLTVSDDSKAQVWDVINGKVVRVVSESLREVTNVAFSPDGKLVFIGSSEKPGQIRNITTGEVRDLSASSENVKRAVFSFDNQFLVTISDYWKARLWNVKTGSFIQDLPGHTSEFGSLGEVTIVQFSPDGNYLATACGSGAGCYLAPVKQDVNGDGAADVLGGYSLDSDGIADFDGTVRIWKKKSGTFEPFHELSTGEDRVYGLAFDPNSKLIATASGDAVARVWEVSTRKPMSAFTGHPNWVWSAAFSPDSNLVVTAGSVGGTARIWEARTGKERFVLRGHQNFVESAVFSPDGKFVLTTGDDGTARIWEINIGQPTKQFDPAVFENIPDPDPSVQQRLRQRSPNWNRAVSSRDHKLVVTFNDQEQSDAIAEVWKADTGTLIRSLREYKDGVLAAAFSPDNKFVALAEYGNTARIWEISTGREIALVGHESFIYHMAFSPNIACVATASDDGIVRLWRTTTGAPLEVLPGIEGKVAMIAFDPSSRSVITIDSNNTARVYSSGGCASISDLRTLTRIYTKKNAQKY